MLLVGTILVMTLLTLVIYFVHRSRRPPARNELQDLVTSWAHSHSALLNGTQYRFTFSRDIIPIPCHSYNYYWRTVPLYDALVAGCTGVEADVWYTNNELLVGHSAGSLTPSRTLKSLYVDPLASIISHQNSPRSMSNRQPNGVFDTSPYTSLNLLIDIKTDGTTTLPVIQENLSILRSSGSLTNFNGSAVVPGPVTAVVTGNISFEQFLSIRTNSDIFFDAPLAEFWGQKATSNRVRYKDTTSVYASVSFPEAIGKPRHGVLTPSQVDIIRGQIRATSAQGLKTRYWDTPSWPVSLRNHVWDVLVKEGVGMLNVDDVDAVSKQQW